MDTPQNAHGLGTPARHSVTELHTYHRNPRVGNVKTIMDSMRVNGVYKPLVVNRGTHTGRPMEVLAGNHSLKAMRKLAETDPDKWLEADCWMVDVDDDAAARIVLVDNRSSDLATYNDEELASLLETLDGDLEGTGFDHDDLADLAAFLENTDDAHLDEKYTGKINIPHYEPSDVCPTVEAMYDDSKTRALLEQIEAAEDLPDDVREFLMQSAHRHTVIDFHQVANFYAHQEPEIQELMEAQALVIIDVDDAIMNGYAALDAKIQMLLGREDDPNDEA